MRLATIVKTSMLVPGEPTTLLIRAKSVFIVNIFAKSRAPRGTSTRHVVIWIAGRHVLMRGANNGVSFRARRASSRVRGEHSVSARRWCCFLMNRRRSCPHYACPVPCGSVSD